MLKFSLGLVLFASLQSAIACSCRHLDGNLYDEIKRNVQVADEVVRVSAIEPATGDQLQGFNQRVRVVEALRSTVAAGDEISVSTGSASCVVTLHQGEEWLLFLRERSVSFCSGSFALANFHPRRIPDHMPTYGETLRRQGQLKLDLVRSAEYRRSETPE